VSDHPQKREQRVLPGTGKGASAGAAPQHRATRAAAGRSRESPPPPQATPHDTPPANNNRMAGSQMSCRQQPAPPPRDAAKMSPRISIGPEPANSFIIGTVINTVQAEGKREFESTEIGVMMLFIGT
jgi:hypothetical protein